MFTTKNMILLIVGWLISFNLYGQVGINNAHAKATLEITAKKTDGSSPEGVIHPRLSGDSLHEADQRGVYGQNQDGVMAFVTAAASPENRVGQTIDIDARGYYYYDYPANKWIRIYGSNTANARVTNLNCAFSTQTGSLTHGVTASGVSFRIPYTGGNGSNYLSQTITSTRVSGLTATLSAGTLGSAGNLTYTVSGTPSGSGTAGFAVSFGGKSCTITMTVNAVPVVTTLNCTGAVPVRSLFSGIPASGVGIQVPYSAGNSVAYPAQSFSSTVVTGLTANLAAGALGTAGNLIYTVSGTPAGVGTAGFAVSFGGKSCTITMTVNAVPVVTTLNCTGVVPTGSLFSGIPASAVSVQVPYSGGNSVAYPAQSFSSTGVTGLTANLAAGTLGTAGNLIYTVSGTPSSSGTAGFAVSFGGKSCTITMPVSDGPAVTQLSCAGGTRTGTLMHGVAATAVKFIIPYTGGNSGSYPAQAFASAGVTGLTANLTVGTLGASGNLDFIISGTPEGVGNAKFSITFGDKSCEFTLPVAANPDPVVNQLNCALGTRTGRLVRGETPVNVSFSIPYTGGNGRSYPQNIITPYNTPGNVNPVRAVLAAGTLANGDGQLTYTISDTPYQATEHWYTITLGGKSCSFNMKVDNPPPIIAVRSLECGNVIKRGLLFAGTSASGVGFSIRYSAESGTGTNYSTTDIPSTGVTGLTATLQADRFNPSGELRYIVSGTPTGSGTAFFAVGFGGKSCAITLAVRPSASVDALNCAQASVSAGTLFSGHASAGVTVMLPYTGGNGGNYLTQTTVSTGVTGLTATLTAGAISSGAGNLTFTISGTPASAGTANFAISFGGKNCSFTIPVSLGPRLSSVDCAEEPEMEPLYIELLHQWLAFRFRIREVTEEVILPRSYQQDLALVLPWLPVQLLQAVT